MELPRVRSPSRTSSPLRQQDTAIVAAKNKNAITDASIGIPVRNPLRPLMNNGLPPQQHPVTAVQPKDSKRPKLIASYNPIQGGGGGGVDQEYMIGTENQLEHNNKSAEAEEKCQHETESSPTQTPAPTDSQHNADFRDTTALFEPIEFPAEEIVGLPPNYVMKALYKHVIKEEEMEMAETLDADITTYDQTYLTDAGILSFEKVLLPALTHQMEKSVKQVQAKIQRDRPEYKSFMNDYRKALWCGCHAAIQAAQESRMERIKINKQREEKWAEEEAQRLAEEERCRQEEIAQKKAEKENLRALKRAKKLREAKARYAPNKELWTEIVYLMTGANKLKEAEEMWKQVGADLDKKEQDLDRREKELEEQKQQKNAMQEDSTAGEDIAGEKKRKTLADDEEIRQIMEEVDAITLSAQRIKQGLDIVNDVAEETEKTRKDLYDQYTKNHQFHGYQSVHNPKALLLALSQSQDDSEW